MTDTILLASYHEFQVHDANEESGQTKERERHDNRRVGSFAETAKSVCCLSEARPFRLAILNSWAPVSVAFENA